MVELIEESIEEMNDFVGCVKGVEVNQSVGMVYKQAKEERLFRMFGDKLIHETPVSYEKCPSEIAEDMRYHPSLRSEIDDMVDDIVTSESMEDTENGDALYSAMSVLRSARGMAEGIYSDTHKFISPLTDKKVVIQKGSKISKALKHFTSDQKKLDRVQVTLSQINSQNRVKGTLCLSIHPLDYMTASANKSGWSSCFNILEEGEYQAAVLSLLTSPNTVMAYLKSGDDVEYEEAGMQWNSKRWRTYLTLNSDNEALHVGREYPFSSEYLVATAVEAAGKLFSKVYDIRETRGDNYDLDFILTAPYNFYNDCDNGFNQLAYTDNYDTEVRNVVDLSPIGAVCIDCGRLFEEGFEGLVCEDCSDFARCEYCEEMHGRDSLRDTSMYSNICEMCIDAYFFTCDECGEEHCEYSITPAFVLVETSNHERHICTDCMKDNNYVTVPCPTCHLRLIDTSDGGEKLRCPSMSCPSEDSFIPNDEDRRH